MAPVILVVEDHAAMLRDIRIGLEMSGYAVVTATDGREALDVLSRQPVDLILADVAMPRMNGYQLYEEIRRNPPWVKIPFVFVSARTLDSDVRYGKSLGADDYLVKPFVLDDLLAIVEGRLRRARDLERAACTAPTLRDTTEVTVVGRLRINSAQHRVWQDDVLVTLTPHEYSFLEYLALRAGQLVSLTELCQATHGVTTNSAEAGKLLHALARSLRRRLGYAAGDTGCIESVRGVGYRLVAAEG